MQIPTAPTPDVLDFLARDHRLFIDGQWRDPGSAQLIAVENPATEQPIATLRAASRGDLDDAVAAARAALDGSWGRMAPAERGKLLMKLADLVEADSLLLGELSTLENGMPLWMSLDKMALLCPDIIRYYAGWTTKVTGETLPAVPVRGEDHEWLVYTLRQPIGVVGCIIPWNAPASMITLKAAPALAAGCTVVMKPAELTPLLAVRFTELVEQAGFPPGVFNLVQGYGHDIGDAIARHPGIDKVAFTGSTAVGKQIVRAAADDLKRVALELGGKSPFIVCADADLDQAAPAAAATPAPPALAAASMVQHRRRRRRTGTTAASACRPTSGAPSPASHAEASAGYCCTTGGTSCWTASTRPRRACTTSAR